MSHPDTLIDRPDALWTDYLWNHYRCRLCGKIVKSHGNFGGGIKAHAMMHVRHGEAEEFYAGRSRSTHLEFRTIGAEWPK